jgi:hypothetical protein
MRGKMRVPIFPVSYYKDSIENNQELKNLIVLDKNDILNLASEIESLS